MGRMTLNGDRGYRWLHVFTLEFVILSNLQLNKSIKTLFLPGRKKRIMKKVSLMRVIWAILKQASVGLCSATSKTVLVAAV